jgi:hypothetical protein
VGQTPKTTANKAEKYEPRVDIMGAISFNAPLACETKTSQQRKRIPNPKKGKIGVKGYTKKMVKDFLRKKLAPKIKDMRVKKVIICLDKGLNFKREEVKEELRLGGADNVGDAWILPTNTAKRVSPLDNTLWHSLKQRVRARKPKSEIGTARIIREEFMAISQRDIQNYYQHCGLTQRSNPTKDFH